jgi:transposase-like protein
MSSSIRKCECRAEVCPNIHRRGFYFRKSDGQVIQRYRCFKCKKGFSSATGHPCYRQNKRHKNEILRKLLSSGVSLRRSARVLNLNRITVERKLLFLAEMAKQKETERAVKREKCQIVEFDDLETFEHSKCKPLSITLAVDSKSRTILDFEVSQMPAKGRLAKIAVKKYGYRRDLRSQGRAKLFERLKGHVDERAIFKSDQNPHYPQDVKRYFPLAFHETHKGQRGSITGQGELKKIRFDPLFSLNHTCAMFRANVNRLFRKTWCTTKRPDRLAAHLRIFMNYHNENLGL